MKNPSFFETSILKAFWEGFGKPKSSIFQFFSIKNGSKISDAFWKAKKSSFEASRANCGQSAAVRAGPGEGIIGWGPGSSGRNLQI